MTNKMLTILFGLDPTTERLAQRTLMRKQETNQALGRIINTIRTSRSAPSADILTDEAIENIREVLRTLNE